MKRLGAVFAAGAVLFGGLVGGCGSGPGSAGRIIEPTPAASPTPAPNPTADAPAELFGTWRLMKITGGITGQGTPIPSPAPTLTFNRNGTVTRTDGTQNAQSTYRVTRRTTFLRTGIVPIVEYGSGALSQIIEQVDAQNLALTDEANDGFGYKYVRVSTGE